MTQQAGGWKRKWKMGVMCNRTDEKAMWRKCENLDEEAHE